MSRTMVTGATSGIGRALAVQFAERGDELILVARDAGALESLRTQLCGDGHEILAADLSDEPQLERVCARLANENLPVDVLVHSAGVGLPPGGYLKNSVTASLMLNQLSIDVLTRLAHAALPGMLKRDHGGLITVGSIAGFLPGSAALTYSAAKAWSNSFGEGLNELTRHTGVTSTVVAPGFVRSGFHDRAGLEASGIHSFMWLSPEQVARAAIAGFQRRRALVIPGNVWKIVYALYRLVPRSWSRAWFAGYMAHTARRVHTK